jgi:Icc-related predicted phosphoesterase
MLRVAACADIHFGTDSAGRLRPDLEHLAERADIFLIAGDLTWSGAVQEADVLAAELDGLTVPVVAVLGNHDYHGGQEGEVRQVLEEIGITVLEGETAVVDAAGLRVGIAGIKGFGGGFAGACATDFGEPEMKAFVRHTRRAAQSLEDALAGLDTDLRLALLHYSPVPETLHGERLEIFPFLGSYLLAEAADRAGADVVIHGHENGGAEKGMTPAGIPVRNVSQPVIRRAYALYTLEADHARRQLAI